MSGLASVETASRVREIIKRGASRVVDERVPGELVGRVVSVDLPRQTARVWFTGDEQPVSVKMFSSTIPGRWQSQLAPGQTANTNLVGYGSMVVCQRFRGELYITDVLTGGQFSYDLATMNQKFISTYPYTYSPNSVFGKLIAAKIHVTITADATQGQSLEFGPFVKTEDSASSNWVKVCINTSIGTTEYEFNISSTQLYSGSTYRDRWYRILPVRETSTNLSSQRDYYDFDVCIKRTQYGLEPQFNIQSDEYWFRLVKRDSDTSFITADVSIETSLFDKPRSTDGNEQLVQTVVTVPPFIKGYIGFHGSQMNISDLNDTKIRDNFNNRTLSGSIGTSEDGTVWTTVNGSGSNYAVSGGKATITANTANVEYTIHNGASRLEYDHDVIVKVSPSHVATGGVFEINVQGRRIDSNNYYRIKAQFNTSGSIDIDIQKIVAGVFTTLQSAAGVLTYTANAEFYIRFQVRDVKLRGKIWSASSAQPLTWNLTHNSDTSLTGAGSSAVHTWRNPSNTNSTLVISIDDFEDNLSQQATFSSGSWSSGPWRSSVLRNANDLQKTWTCTSGFNWDSTNGALGWDGEIILTGIGRHRNGLTEGALYVTCPKNVTNYVIPVFGSASPTTIAVHANGVVIADGRSLYVAIPPGERNVDLMENLFLVDSSVNGVDFQLPEWAVLIAHRQVGTHLIRLGNGEWAGAVAVEVVTTDFANYASTSYAASSTGLAQCGTTFIAPQSGKVGITWSAECSSTDVNFTLVSVEVRAGATVGSGTVVFGPDDNYTARSDTSATVGSFARKNITGLTPGTIYNVRTMHKRGANTNGQIARRKIWVDPVA